jgi:hypothetical protein
MVKLEAGWLGERLKFSQQYYYSFIRVFHLTSFNAGESQSNIQVNLLHTAQIRNLLEMFISTVYSV